MTLRTLKVNILAGASARNAANVNCSFIGNSLGVCAAIAATNAASAPAPLGGVLKSMLTLASVNRN